MIAEHDGTTGQVLREYVWLDDMPLALVTGSAPAPQYSFIHTGQLDEPWLVTDMAQARQWDVVNDPWGNALPLATPTIAQDLRLPGQMLHLESGLFQNWHRDYEPTLGRYIEADPIGLDGGSNLFAYANDNPVNAIDPEGLNPALVRGAAAAGELAGQGFVWWCRSNLALCARTIGPPIVRASKAIKAAGSAISDWCSDEDDNRNECQLERDIEEKYCNNKFFYNVEALGRCYDRARDNYDLCIRRHPGLPYWSDADEDGVSHRLPRPPKKKSRRR